MGDVRKDCKDVLRLHMSGSDKIRAAGSLTDFVVKVFKERIKREHPQADQKQLLRILREELSDGRRDYV